jgi:signal transduction histidine kinase
MVLWRGPDFVFEKVNPAYQAIFGERQLEGLPISQAVPELVPQGFPELLRKVLETGQPFIGVEILAKVKKTVEGPLEDRYYDFTYVRISDPEGKPYGVYDHAIDVTDRVATRQRLEENELRLRSSVEDLEREKVLRERFVAALTHDLRTPMTAVKITAQLLQRKHTGLETVQTSMQRIISNIDRADRMIRDLLDANRIKAGGGIPILPERCDLAQLADSVVSDMRELHGPRFSLRGDSGSIVGYWDPGSLRRIIENLAGNALKYGREDAPISVILSKGEGRAEIAVHNEGNPISAADQASLFRPYRRTNSAVSGGQRGWGIGLTLVKGLAEAHRGTIGVVSNEQDGTTFYVRLPLDSRGKHGSERSE